MKFFSNDAKENSDEPYGRDHGDVVTSDPVAVPQQRAGSPWSDGPATTEAETSDTAGTDTEVGSPDDELAQQERRDGTEEDLPADQPEDTGEEPVSRRDETDTLTTYHPDGTVETSEDSASEDSASADSAFADSAPGDSAPGDSVPGDSVPGDSASEDEPGSDPALRRDVVEAPADVTETPVETEPVETSPVGTEDETAKDRAEAQAEADQTVDEARADEAVAESEETPVAAAAVAATPGSVPAAPLDRLFADGDSFAERFREIQLKFVDSPKEATADAATLVGEAVDKLTSALQAQKDALGGDSDDTEQLRVQLRSYRDLLNRLSAL